SRPTALWTSRSGGGRAPPVPRTRWCSTLSTGPGAWSRRAPSRAAGRGAGRAQAISQLRERRIGTALAAIAAGPEGQTLAERIRAVWPALLGEESRVLDQAMGLMMYDPVRYAELGRGAAQQDLPTLLALCPPDWTDRRK